MLGGDKEDERAKWSEGGRYRGEAKNGYRVKAFADDHEWTRKRKREREREEGGEKESAAENEEKRAKVWERKCDEGFTAAVMFVGSRNFGVSESGEESYLNEPG